MISTKIGPSGTVLDALRQAGSLKLLFPRNSTDAMQAVLVNTAGGVTGGDQFSVQGGVAAKTELTVTTQAAERAYRAQPGQSGCLTSRFTVSREARLNWVPQETILFEGCNLERNLRIDLEGSARLLFCEPLVFGRVAMGEELRAAQFNDRVEIWRDGVPLYLDAVRLHGDIASQMSAGAVAHGARACAAMVLVDPEAEAHLEPIRQQLGPTAGASLLRPDVLVLRALAPDSFTLRKTLMPILSRLLGGSLPRPWMI